MLDPALAQQLSAYLTKVVHPVELVSTLDASTASGQLAELLDEVAALSGGRVTHVRTGDALRRPSFRVVREGTDVEVEFAGLPLGHEFTSLVLALLQVGGHPSTAPAELLDAVRGLGGEHRFETYFSQSCQNCPDVVQALNLMSILNPGISHVAIDGAVFPGEVEERGVLAVPMVFRNGELFGQGRMTLEEVVARLDAGAAERDAERLAALEPFEVLVVGGGPAGSSAAIYTARKGIRTGLLAVRFGGQLLDTMTIENYPSVEHTEGPRMAADLERQVRGLGVEVVTGQVAERLVPAPVPGGLHEVHLGSGAVLRARAVVIASGARWRTLDVPGEDEHRNRGVTFCPHCDGPLFVGKRVAVVGGGNSGVEAAIDLAGVVEHVTLVEFADELKADDVLQRKVRSLGNIDVLLGTATTEVVGDGSRVVGLRHAPRAGGEATVLPVEGVFVQIGLLPNTEWLDGVVEMTPSGEVVVDARGATGIPGVFAAGDCTTAPWKQIVAAAGAGAGAALSAFDHLIRTSAPAASDADEAAARA
ncbi:alkyl hydroperoxide reductase subunit F [Fodinibacter luteus]|uniref:Alkyl hydroperoxide reductase subunit F n=1 Tax=Fodinibacter luteus TaxID=552064 RepID=A0ABP8KT05_9MICO